ncbi:MAG: hypothetical protein ABI557_04610 [Aureliella sp.]
MRANLKHFLARLALIAMITSGLSFRLSAHDLPADRSLAESATANCFTSSSSAAPPLASRSKDERSTAASETAPPTVDDWSRRTLVDCALHQARPVLHALSARPELWKQFSQTTAALSTLCSPAQAVLTKRGLQPKSSLVIAAPDAGVAPHPSSVVLSAASSTAPLPKCGEVYMPYDFHMSDWRFGQFRYHGKTASAPSLVRLPSLVGGISRIPALAEPIIAEPKSHTPTRQSLALADFFQQIDRWQSTTGDALRDGDALTRAAAAMAKSIRGLVVAGGRSLLAGNPASSKASSQNAAPASDLLGPQFVIYDTTIGGQIVSTLAQARVWQLQLPSAPSTIKSQQRLSELLSAGFRPIQTSVLATATDGLERAGQTLLSLSHSLSNFSQTHVASGAQAKRR